MKERIMNKIRLFPHGRLIGGLHTMYKMHSLDYDVAKNRTGIPFFLFSSIITISAVCIPIGYGRVPTFSVRLYRLLVIIAVRFSTRTLHQYSSS